MQFSKKILSVVGFVALATGTLVSGSASATPSYCDTVAGNLIQNCGFETGDLTHWGQIPASSGSDFGVSSAASTGSFGLYFGNLDGKYDQVFQGFSTTPGHRYQIDLSFNTDGGTPSGAFTGWYDGAFHLLGGGLDFPVYNWVPVEFFYVATTNGSSLIFGGYDVPGFVGIDDVIVRDLGPVPEPITLSLFGAGLAGAVAMRRRKKSA